MDAFKQHRRFVNKDGVQAYKSGDKYIVTLQPRRRLTDKDWVWLHAYDFHRNFSGLVVTQTTTREEAKKIAACLLVFF